MATSIESTESDFQRFADYRPTAMDQRGLGADGQEDWLVVPMSRQPKISTLLEDSNWDALVALIEAADPESEDHEIHYFGHWTSDFEIIVVRPHSAAHVAAADAICALSEYLVLDESDYSERESEAAYENVLDAVRPLTFEYAEGDPIDSETVAEELYRWFSEHGNWGFLESPDTRSVRESERDRGLEALGWTLYEDDVYRRIG
jgi:hypothetical protein